MNKNRLALYQMNKKKKNKLKSLEKKVISFFRAHPHKAYNYKQVAAVLGIHDTKTRNELIKVMSLCVQDKTLRTPSRGKYMLNEDSSQLQMGILEVTSNGNGYVICTDLDQDIRIARKNLNTAFDGDKVQVYLYRRRSKNGALEGEIAKIIERKKIHFVGQLQIDKNHAFVLTRGPRMYTDFYIEKKQLTPDYADGDKVVVEFEEWPKRADSPFGKLIETLGPPGETATEMHAILSDYGLPFRFPDGVEDAASAIDQSISLKEIKKRRDFRSTLTFTIDPKTAKDFDDALSYKVLDENSYEVGIHIADVSHYVTPNSVLDREAYERATSVYLVDRVVPMLPEVLSNGVCSLRPREEKYTFSAVFTVDKNGTIQKEWFGKTVIYSDHRFAYEEVQEILETEQPLVSSTTSLSGKEYKVSKEIFDAVTHLDMMAKNLRKRRMKNGALSFDRVEVNFDLDEENEPKSVYFKSSKDANKLVEEFMLLANKRVASFAGKRQKPLSFVYRVHDEPDPDKLFNLKGVVGNFGYALNLKSKNINKSLNELLQASHGTQEQNLIDTLTIRCMSKAEYTTQNIGHYGLAFDFYSHFTSPIRRYPDVLVHRLMESYLDKQTYPYTASLEEACHHASQKEQIATKAERDSIKFMQIKFMQDKVGKVFSGVISGVTDRGIYVELSENKCEGMVRLKDIPGDYFYFDEKNHSLIGERTQQVFRLGDEVEIEVLKADLQRRHLDYALVLDI